MQYRIFVIFIILLAVGTLAACSGDKLNRGEARSSRSPTAVATGDAERGATLFLQGKDGAPGCRACHLDAPGGFGASQISGPSLVGLAERAGSQVAGLDAEAYLRQSILSPNEFLVEGYNAIMFPNYADYLTEQDIANLIAYLLGL